MAIRLGWKCFVQDLRFPWPSSRGGLLLLVLLVFLFLAAIAPDLHASSVELSGCQCLLKPGDIAHIALKVANTGAKPLELRIAVQLPSGIVRYFSQDGLVSAPSVLTRIPPSTAVDPIDILNLKLESDSLPFGDYPIVGPFRYHFLAQLFDPESGEEAVETAGTWFDFLPRAPASFPTDPGTIYLVPHQHNEIAWLESEDVYLPLGVDYIRRSILEAERSSSYRFALDQQPVLEAFVSKYPELVDRLRSLIYHGVCELAGGFFVESDLNLLSGESLVRQVIYGQQYLERNWGRRSRIAWNLDTFGHPHQLPQIVKQAGMDYYVFSRGIADLSRLAGPNFYWQSQDGSSVLAHYLPLSYTIGRGVGASQETDNEISEIFARLQMQGSGPLMLAPSGADVGQEVFNAYVPEAVDHWNRQQMPGVQTKIATPGEFFDELKKSGAMLPVTGKAEFEDSGSSRVFPGAYASRIEVKQTNNRLEHLILDVEKLATVASLEGFSYPEHSLREQGEALARNQTHDYLPGTGVDSIYKDTDGLVNDLGDRFAAIEAALNRHLQDAGRYISERVNTAAVYRNPIKAWVVFNSMAWQRDGLVSIAIKDPQSVFPARLLDADGKEVPYQRVEAGRDGTEIVFLAHLQALGYTTYYLLPGAPAQAAEETTAPFSGPASIDLGGFTAETDGSGLLRQIYSNLRSRSLLPGSCSPMELSGGVLWWADDPHGNAYEYGPLSNSGSLLSSPQSVIRLLGPVMTRILAEGPIAAASNAVREMRLVPELERIDFITTVDWHDKNKNLYVRFPAATVGSGNVVEGTPYGFMNRPNGHYPALLWADYGDDLTGISILNRGLFGHEYSTSSGAGGSPLQLLDVTLLRSLDRAVFGEYPSVTMMEQGVHRFEYSLVPRDRSWREKEVPRLGWEFNSPFLVFETGIHAGVLPPRKTYLELNGPDGVVSVLQKEGSDLIVRLYETSGSRTSISLTFPGIGVATIRKTDLIGGRPEVIGYGTSVVLNVKPEEIVTLRLSPRRHSRRLQPRIPPMDYGLDSEAPHPHPSTSRK